MGHQFEFILYSLIKCLLEFKTHQDEKCQIFSHFSGFTFKIQNHYYSTSSIYFFAVFLFRFKSKKKKSKHIITFFKVNNKIY